MRAAPTDRHDVPHADARTWPDEDPTVIAALVAGFGIGLLVALQVGPIFLLCARTSARFGFAPGAAIGAGAATVDLVYAVLGALGASLLLTAAPLRLALGLAGGMVLAYMGLRTLYDAFRIRLGGESELEVVAPGWPTAPRCSRRRATRSRSSPGPRCSRARPVSDLAGEPWHAAAFVAGTALGSLTSHLVLAGAMSRSAPGWGRRRCG